MDSDDEGGGFRLKNRKLIYLGVFITILLCLTLFVTAVAGDKLHWMMIGFYTLSAILLFFSILLLMLEIRCFDRKISLPSIRKKGTGNISMIDTKDGAPRMNSEIPYDVGDDGMSIPEEMSSSDSFESSDSDHEDGKGMTFSVNLDRAKQPSVEPGESKNSVTDNDYRGKTFSMSIDGEKADTESVKSGKSSKSSSSDTDRENGEKTSSTKVEKEKKESLSLKSSYSDSDNEDGGKMSFSINVENVKEISVN